MVKYDSLFGGIFGGGRSSTTSTTTTTTTTYVAPAVEYGFNGLMNYVGFTFQEPLFIEQIKQFKFRRVRWPNGGIANVYRWQDGLPDDGSAMRPNTLNYLQFLCLNANMKANIVLNMMHTLQDQIACIDAAKKLGIDFVIEMGNEANNLGNILKTKYPTAKDYATTCNTWITEIKKRWPTLKCGIAGGDKPYKDGHNWNYQMIQWCKNFDFFILHSYADPDYYADSHGGIDPIKLDKVCQSEISASGLKGIDKEVCVTEYNWKYNDKQGVNVLNDYGQQFVPYYMSKRYPELLPQISMMLVHNIVGRTGILDIVRDDITNKPKVVLLNTGIAMKRFFDEQANKI